MVQVTLSRRATRIVYEETVVNLEAPSLEAARERIEQMIADGDAEYFDDWEESRNMGPEPIYEKPEINDLEENTDLDAEETWL
jgi:hypothetical protein